MQTYELSCVPSAASAVSVCASQSPGAGAITLTGSLVAAGVATLGAAQNITLVSGGNDSGITFTITGTDADGVAQTEAVVGANAGTATGVSFFKTVTGITHTGSVATTLTAGNAITSVSPTFFFYKQRQPSACTVGVTLVSGTATYAFEDCFTDPPHTRYQTNATITAKSASFAYAYGDLRPMATRIKVTASTAGNLKANFVSVMT